jgi:hypothetical protein
MMVRVGVRTVQTPSGQEWCIGRRWINRRMPHWRKVHVGKAHAGDVANALNIPAPAELDDIGAAILIIAAAIVVAVIVIPLLLFGIELIALGLVVAVSIAGRTLLGRPWVVQATPDDDSARTLTWRVVGWRRSRRLIAEVAASCEAGLNPAPAEAAELLRTA